MTGVDVAGEYTAGGGPADSFNVIFYDNSGSNLPGNIVASRPGNSYTGGANAVITLTSPVSLGQGTYWVAVQSRQDFTPFGQWFWDNRFVSANQGAAWQNPGDGFGTGCTTYANKITCLDGGQNGPDQLFRINGTTGGGGPSCSGGAITINDEVRQRRTRRRASSPGMSGSISDINVQLNGLNHTYPDDIDMLLVAPDGTNAIFMSRMRAARPTSSTVT